MSKIRLQTFRFYNKSRDSWKKKHKEKQGIIKYLKVKIRDLQNSRDYWKEKAKKLDTELKKNKKK